MIMGDGRGDNCWTESGSGCNGEVTYTILEYASIVYTCIYTPIRAGSRGGRGITGLEDREACSACMAIPLGGGGGMSEEVKTLGEAPPPTSTKDSQKFHAVFLFRDPPSPSFWIRPCLSKYNSSVYTYSLQTCTHDKFVSACQLVTPRKLQTAGCRAPY